MGEASPDPIEDSVVRDAAGDLLYQRIEPLFRSSYPALANVMIASLVAVAARNYVPLSYLLVWIALMGAFSFLRIRLGSGFLQSGAEAPELLVWERRLLGCVAGQGLLWAATGLAIARFPMPPEVLAIVAMAVCGMLAGATFSLTGSQRVFRAYVIPAGIGTIAGIALMGHEGSVVIALMGLVYVAVVLVWGRAIAKSMEERLSLAAEKETLLANLELAQREAELEREFKQETFNKLGHELRTPLNSIIGFAEIIGGEAVGPIGSTKYKEYGCLVAESGKHLASLIDEMLTLARGDNVLPPVDGEPVNVSDVMVFCRDLLAPFAKTRGIDLRLLRNREPLPQVLMDPLKLRQVLINLLNNAIHYTLQGGRIELSAKLRDGGFLEIRVSDTGIGMTEAEIPRALEPFNQLESGKTYNPHGKGIGLALSKKFVEMYGGRMEIESEPGVGTAISVVLPAVPPQS
ncbi:HAMP domain-containing histidine kinase [Nisaea acidiphila]|uniref:histidine kinase n=1 Tax=Nisaea acidiphila TaxID=1862145 RepID=A0A9J7ATQ2_9PROT|nr:HAMP domain-containing sensor histidine kinase [Nisaea acidiphila]UUX51075.1 HAMP domain-containing histidine kinase [Nisaea acidiphila]